MTLRHRIYLRSEMTRILLTQLTIFSILVLGISSFAFPDFEQSRKINNPFKWKESHKGLDCITEVIRTFNLGDQLKVKRDLKNNPVSKVAQHSIFTDQAVIQQVTYFLSNVSAEPLELPRRVQCHKSIQNTQILNDFKTVFPHMF